MRLAVTIALCATLLGACSGGDDDDGTVRVVATTTHAADLARQVAGERAEVVQLLAPGTDPHGFEPRPSDARAVTEADLVVRSGGEVDEWLGDLLDQAGADAETVTLLDAVRAQGDDPHWWHDPRNARLAVAAISEALAQADPAGAREYRRNARVYTERLARLDRDVAECVDRLPAERRKLVTSHDSLGYYARRYGFEVLGAALPSLSSQAQPSGAATERLVRRIREERVPAIFPESALDAKLERAIAREADARVADALWADALGPEGSAGATYAGALADNTRTIVSALSEGRVDCDLEP